MERFHYRPKPDSWLKNAKMCSSLEPGVSFKVDFEWLVQMGSLPGGNASLSMVRTRAGLPRLQWTLRRNLWGRAQTEEVTRSSEGEKKILIFTTSLVKDVPKAVLSQIAHWWSAQATHVVLKSQVEIWYQQSGTPGPPGPLKYLFIFLCVAFGGGLVKDVALSLVE